MVHYVSHVAYPAILQPINLAYGPIALGDSTVSTVGSDRGVTDGLASLKYSRLLCLNDTHCSTLGRSRRAAGLVPDRPCKDVCRSGVRRATL
jgi:hypothetical protein